MGLLIKLLLLTTLLAVIHSAPLESSESTTVGKRPIPALFPSRKTDDTSKEDSSEDQAKIAEGASRPVRDIHKPPGSQQHRPEHSNQNNRNSNQKQNQNQRQQQHLPQRRTRDVNIQKPARDFENTPHSDVQNIPRTRDVPHPTQRRPVREASDSTTQKAVTLPLLLGPNDPTPTYKPLKQKRDTESDRSSEESTSNVPRTRDVPHPTEARPVREAGDSTTQKAVTLPLLLGPNDPTPTYQPLKQKRDTNSEKPTSDNQHNPRTRDVPHSAEIRPVREAGDSTTQKAVTLPLQLGPNDSTPTYQPLKQ